MQKIFLVPLSFSNSTLLKRIYLNLREIFHNNVFLSEMDIDIMDTYSGERNQYYSTKIIAEAVPRAAALDGKVVVLVDFDLYVPVFTFVFGEAQLRGKISVVSSCRLHEEFYTGETNDKLFLERVMKEILHELGHNFGLLHCRDWDCVMHSSAAIEQVDIKGAFYCDKCIAEIPELDQLLAYKQ
jgi:archaemetzincin